jgi:hypothetical protein
VTELDDLTDLEPGAEGRAMELLRLVLVLVVFLGLALVLMAATHVGPDCGGG